MNHFFHFRLLPIVIAATLSLASPVLGQDERVHVVRTGETLFRISQQYGVSVPDLSAWNGLTANTIEVGQRLRLQGPAAPAASAAPAAPAARAQQTEAAAPRLVIQTRRDIVRLEQEYDRYLQQVLATYFDPTTFFVHTRLLMNEVEVRSQERSTRVPPRPIDQFLPGLPAIPEYLRNTIATGTQEDNLAESRSLPDIGQIDLEIIVTDSYADDQVAIMRDLASSAVKLSPQRGDRIRMVRRVLPPKWDLPATPEIVVESEPAPVQVAPWWSVWWPLLLIVAVLAGLGIYFARREPTRTSMSVTRGGFSYEPIAPTTNSQAVQRVTEKIYAGRLDHEASPREWLLQAFMNHTHDMARLLDDWIRLDPSQGLHRASQVVLATDPKLLAALIPAMEVDNGTRLAEKVAAESLYVTDSELLSGVVSDLIEGIKERERLDSLCFRLRTLRHFDFAGYVDVDLLTQILFDESPLTCAFAIAHLDATRVDRVMAGLGLDVIPAIMTHLGEVERISRDVYVAQSEHLFRRFTGLELEDGRWAASDQELAVRACEVLERQSIDFQTQVYRRLIDDPAPMSQSVGLKLITMANLSDQDPDLLRMVCDEMDIETLAVALQGQGQAVERILIRNRSPRERQIYKTYQVETDALGTAQRENARQSLLNRVRKAVRSTGVLALLLWVAGCAATEPIPSQPVVKDTLRTESRTAPSSTLQKTAFDELHARYQVLYNRMIGDYFQAQTHLASGNNEAARAAALRALAVMPTTQTYELLILVARQTGHREDLVRWLDERNSLQALLDQGKYPMPDGTIISIRKP